MFLIVLKKIQHINLQLAVSGAQLCRAERVCAQHRGLFDRFT